MNLEWLRRGPALAFAFMLAGMVAASGVITAQTQPKGAIERFSGTTVNMTGAGDALKIDLLRWSTDAERDQFLGALAKSEKDFVGLLEKSPTLGYVWTSESAGYSIRYAVRTVAANGGERLVFVTDRRLGSWNPQIWKPAGSATATAYPFTVIELRLNRSGTGEGKASLTTNMTVDNEAKTIALENYAAAPVALKGARRDTPRS